MPWAINSSAVGAPAPSGEHNLPALLIRPGPPLCSQSHGFVKKLIVPGKADGVPPRPLGGLDLSFKGAHAFLQVGQLLLDQLRAYALKVPSQLSHRNLRRLAQ